MTPNQTHPDHLDRVLSDFFRNELPHPWPGPRATAEPAGPARDRTAAADRSRYTLAASVALLLGLGVYLSSGTAAGRPGRGPGSSDLLNKADAQGNKLLRDVNPTPMDPPPMGVPNMP